MVSRLDPREERRSPGTPVTRMEGPGGSCPTCREQGRGKGAKQADKQSAQGASVFAGRTLAALLLTLGEVKGAGRRWRLLPRTPVGPCLCAEAAHVAGGPGPWSSHSLGGVRDSNVLPAGSPSQVAPGGD